MNQPTIVLVGGGHTHALFLLNWSKLECKPGQVTLISLADHTPYSGMLPGLVAGHYATDEAHIDLRALCRRADATFIESRVNGIDPNSRKVLVSGKKCVSYDILSINIGAAPDLATAGAQHQVIPVKPISDFYQTWNGLLEQLQNNRRQPSASTIAVVGGGASGVELIQAIHHRLQKARSTTTQVDLLLIQGGHGQPENYPAKLQKVFADRLADQGISVHESFSVSAIEKTHTGSLLRAIDGRTLEASHVFWCTQAAAPAWLKNTQLNLDQRGFIEVEDTLQTVAHPDIFACGDCASMINHSAPKAGVYAVRQAKILTRNVMALINKAPLLDYIPQKNYLSIVTGGERWALASRGKLCLPIFAPKLVWRWKRYIDKSFMNQFDA